VHAHDPAVHLDGFQHADLVDGPADLGILDVLQRLADLGFRRHRLLLSALG
jgi:hypothetical protein